MIVQDFTIDKYQWYVKVYYAVSFYPIVEIVNDLYSTGCSDEEVEKCVEELEKGNMNDGWIHSNKFARRSLIIIGMTDSAEQFLDTWDHEKGHLAMHICITDNIDPYSEEYQYLTGEIGRQMFKAAQPFLCDECRKHLLEEE